MLFGGRQLTTTQTQANAFYTNRKQTTTNKQITMAKLLSGQYEALKERVTDALRKEFELNISQSELDDLVNKERDRMGDEYKNLEQELQEIESQYNSLKEREGICTRKIKNIIFEKDKIKWDCYQDVTCFSLNNHLTQKAKKIARENGLIRNLSNKASKLVSNEVYMANTRDKDMDEILTNIIDRCLKEINSNPQKYLE